MTVSVPMCGYISGFIVIYLTVYIGNVFGQSEEIFKPASVANQLIGALIGGVISGSVISVVVGVLFNRKTTMIKEEIGHQFEIIRSKRAWKEQSVSKVLAPVSMLLDRTDLAFNRWLVSNLFQEAEIWRESNQKIRDILLENGHLIPPELLSDSSELINHYDRWLQMFDEGTKRKNPESQDTFTFGDPNYPFPKTSAEKFQKCFKEYWKDLYKTDNTARKK